MTNLLEISKIIVITDSIHAARSIFDSSIYPLQVHSATISKELREFFSMNSDNSMKFWEYPSRCDWSLFKAVDRDTKQFCQILMLSCKSLWDFSKKRECNDIIHNWKMTFQASDLKGWQFLDLVDNDNISIEPSYSNGRSWLKFIGHSNLLCTRVMRAIVNHAPIGEYRLCFFPKEEFKCPCGSYPIKTRQHILHECQRFNNYWNLRRDSLSYFILFLEFNSSAFAFDNAIK